MLLAAGFVVAVAILAIATGVAARILLPYWFHVGAWDRRVAVVALAAVALASALNTCGYVALRRASAPAAHEVVYSICIGEVLGINNGPLVRLVCPDRVSPGQSWEARLDVWNPSLIAGHTATEAMLNTAAAYNIFRARPSILEAHISAPGFEIRGGEPSRQRFGPTTDGMVWSWTLKPEAGVWGDRTVEVMLYDAEDPAAPVPLGSISAAVTIEPTSAVLGTPGGAISTASPADLAWASISHPSAGSSTGRDRLMTFLERLGSDFILRDCCRTRPKI